MAQWVLERGEAAGLGTQTLPGAGALYVPLRGARRVAGVLGVVPERVRLLLRPDQFRLLEACADQTALALERALLASEAERSRLRAESERLQNTLLGSVSHDLRTPLAGITGAASSLLAEWDRLTPETRAELLTSVVDEATRLNRLVGNLLDVTRIESGALRLRRQWNSVEEVVGAALSRLGQRLAGREVTVHVAPELGLVSFDEVLVEQALVNLIDNAARYTPAGSAIEIQSGAAGPSVWIEVVDHGPGLRPGEEERVFDKFYRARGGDGPGGIGLGLTISRGIVEAHGGTLTAENAPAGGAVFRITLPREEEPPEIDRGADRPAT